MSRPQRPRREQDPRVRRSAARALGWSLTLVALALGVVGVRVHQVNLAYRFDALRAERVKIERLVRQLEIEAATLGSPRRLESAARQLGMVPPARGEVRLAREYVTEGSGLAAARVAARTEVGGR